jgi:hypothetical protein
MQLPEVDHVTTLLNNEHEAAGAMYSESPCRSWTGKEGKEQLKVAKGVDLMLRKTPDRAAHGVGCVGRVFAAVIKVTSALVQTRPECAPWKHGRCCARWPGRVIDSKDP